MSTRTTFRPQAVITAGDMSQATITSAPTILQSLTRVGYAVSWTGTSPVGNLIAQLSNDYALNADGTVLNSGTWTQISLSINGSIVTAIPISGNTGNGFIDIDGTAAYAVRIQYQKTSGTGTFTATVNAKVS